MNYKKLVFGEDENKNIGTLEETSKNVEIQCLLHISSAMVSVYLTRDIDVNYSLALRTVTFLICF